MQGLGDVLVLVTQRDESQSKSKQTDVGENVS